MNRYVLTAEFESDADLSTYDIIAGTPDEAVRWLLQLCSMQVDDARVVSFKLEREGKPIPQAVIENGDIIELRFS